MKNHHITKKFTLIEMLVVIAIIGILASLLMPSLHQALSTAKSVSCQNNLRQLNFGMVGYTSENNSWFPSTFTWNRRDLNAGWSSATKTTAGIRIYMGSDDANLDPVFWGCPDSPDYGNKITYSMNDRLGGIYQWPPQPPRRQLNKLKDPQDTICLIDSRGGSGDIQVTCLMTSYGRERHNSKPSVLWADGHMSSVDDMLIYGNSLYWKADNK